MRCAACLLIFALALPQDPIVVHPPRLPDQESVEPPERFRLQAGDWSAPVILGEKFRLPASAAGAECRLDRMPTRRFALAGALSFDYPDGAQFLAATHVPEFCWWHVMQDGEFLMLQRHRGTGGAAHHRELYFQNSLKAGSADAGSCSLTLDGLTITGRAISGRTDLPFMQEIYAFESAGATWLLVLNHAPDAPRPLRDELARSFRFEEAR